MKINLCWYESHSYGWTQPCRRRKDIELFHKRTNTPSIQMRDRRSHSEHTIRATGKACINTMTNRRHVMQRLWVLTKPTPDLSLPSRSHNCMASKLRSLSIPSQGLNGLVMLCAKPGTSISAEASGWCCCQVAVECRSRESHSSKRRPTVVREGVKTAKHQTVSSQSAYKLSSPSPEWCG